MAYLFSLSAECGADKSIAEDFAKHFEELTFKLVTGTTSVCKNWVHQNPEMNWWVTVLPSEITKTGVNSKKDCIELSELGLRLYKHLLTAPFFRYALAGVEVDDFMYYSDLFKSVCTYPDERRALHGFTGLILRKEIWKELGEPIAFVKFKTDYVWQIYYGEKYSPAFSEKDLLELWQSITPRHNPKTNSWDFDYLNE